MADKVFDSSSRMSGDGEGDTCFSLDPVAITIPTITANSTNTATAAAINLARRDEQANREGVGASDVPISTGLAAGVAASTGMVGAITGLV